jgi:hypothetical protein
MSATTELLGQCRFLHPCGTSVQGQPSSRPILIEFFATTDRKAKLNQALFCHNRSLLKSVVRESEFILTRRRPSRR